ncbi:MAG: hypothetical protein ACI841_001133 [Planctomycetota bacterium]|jgi:hypothetical protein
MCYLQKSRFLSRLQPLTRLSLKLALAMQTLLSRFCEEFNGVLRPVLGPLRRAGETLGEASADTPGREILPPLLDARHDIETLADKVEAQQAYVLIFGPLKSGKSTLMNAVSAAYVSEVTSLPAYPCMVYVSHADEQEFKVHRYNGKVEKYTDSAALHIQVNRGHTELADHIRKNEAESQQDFDPAIHFQEAIRRVDVRIPAGHLAKSGAVLVDTPGLYSRMKFGYDRMTREFRNAAAVAIFVVKSDNLFLEQVFNEFNQLLELFSRIFLVVNLDTSKVDLRPDGSLEPSLERRDPLRIIEAFENLAMSAGLKEAADQGRLRIYPVDLLRAASERLQEGPTENGKSNSAPYEGQANFDAFTGDLTEFLNSTEYLVAFLGDSLRQANAFLTEVRELCNRPAIDDLRVRVEDLERRQEVDRSRLRAFDRLINFEWKQAFESLQTELGAQTTDHAGEVAGATVDRLHEAVADWFRDDSSMQTLITERLVPILGEHRDHMADHLQSALSERVEMGQAGILVPAETGEDLQDTGILLSDFGQEAVNSVRVDSREPSVGTPLDIDTIPVKKGLLDWLFFRSAATVRQRLMGPTSRPGTRIPRAMKAKLIGAAGRSAMLASLDRHREGFFALTLETIRSQVLVQYTCAVTEAMQSRFQAEKEVVEGSLTEIEKRLKEHRRVLNHLTTLQAETDRALSSIDQLSESYGQTDPDMLNQPLDKVELEDVSLIPQNGTADAVSNNGTITDTGTETKTGTDASGDASEVKLEEA